MKIVSSFTPYKDSNHRFDDLFSKTVECLVDDLVVYEDCLYMADYAEYGAYIQYKGYDLNADGTIKAELDEESDDFICKEQNVYEKRGYKVGKTFFPF